MEQSIISSDSHVIEVPDLWEKGMPASLRERAPKAFFDEKRDAWMFGSPEVQIQAVGGLFMAGQQPENLEKFRRAGFAVARPGGWDPIVRQDDMVTDGVAAEVLYPSLGLGLYCVKDAALQESLFRTYNDWIIDYCSKVPDRLFDMIFSGVLERYPKLKVVSVENEIGWMPFWLEKCDKAYKRHRHSEKVPMTKLPSEYFAEQIYATFFNDRVGGQLFSWWGVDNCMWSNDYPHQNSTWPNSRAVIERDMAHLSAADRDKLLNTNVRKLYKLNTPASLPKAA